MGKNFVSTIKDKLHQIKLCDAHSHIVAETTWKNKEDDFTFLLWYSITDLINAGLPKDDYVFDTVTDAWSKFDYGYDPKPDSRDVAEKWKSIKPYWPYVKNTGAGALVRKTLQLFFDCDDLTDETVLAITEKINYYKVNYSYEELLNEKYGIHKLCGVTKSVRENPCTDLIKQQLYTDSFSGIQGRRDVYRLEQYANTEIYSLKTYIQALDKFLEEQVAGGIVGFKWHYHSHLRELDFAFADRCEAARCLDRVFSLPPRGSAASGVSIGYAEMRPFQDYVQNHLIRRAIDFDLPIQIHTGTIGETLGNQISNANPTHLVPLFLKYPQARFNLLHAGFPYTAECAELARMFPNVYLNMAWTDTLSPQVYMRSLKEWITYLPLNKLFAFGADHLDPLLTIASAERVREMTAKVLSELVQEGHLKEEDILFVGKHILGTNVQKFYRL